MHLNPCYSIITILCSNRGAEALVVYCISLLNGLLLFKEVQQLEIIIIIIIMIFIILKISSGSPIGQKETFTNLKR